MVVRSSEQQGGGQCVHIIMPASLIFHFHDLHYKISLTRKFNLVVEVIGGP